MSQQIINIGAAPNDGKGDPIRTAYAKCNGNFTQLYNRAQPYPPNTLVGRPGDQAGMYAYDSAYFYYCFANYDGSSEIWSQIAQSANIVVTGISNGNSAVTIPQYNGNVIINVGAVSNVLTASQTGIYVNGVISSAGNVVGYDVIANNSLIAPKAKISNIIISNNDITSDNGLVNINSGLDLVDFAVSGTKSNVLFVSASSNTVSLNSNIQIPGATLAVNSTDSILLPVGTTVQRPPIGYTGMLRFNTSINNLEVFDNSQWTPVGTPPVTVVTDDQFTGDGISTTFFLTSSQTTNSCLVSINGIVQIPTTAYSVAGTIITFTAPPDAGDTIDVRGIIVTEVFDSQFVGDNYTVTFALNSNQTTNSCIVSINGIIQTPVLAYNVLDNLLTFTSPPSSGDTIDVREYLGSTISDNQYTGTGAKTTFILGGSYTTIGCIVSINGVVQLPGSAYVINGSTMVFSQAPDFDDIIDVREFTIVPREGLYNSSGNASVVVSETAAEVDITGNLVVTGNVIAPYFIGDGSLLSNINMGNIVGSYSNTNVSSYLSSALVSNIIPFGNNIAYLGNSTNRWKELWLSGNTIYLGDVALSISTGNALMVNGQDVVTTSNVGNTVVSNLEVTGDITTTGVIEAGNVSATYFVGDGSQLTNLNIANAIGGYGNSNVAEYLPTYSGDISSSNITVANIITSDSIKISGSISPTDVLASPAPFLTGFDTVSAIRLSASGNITGAYILGNGSQLTGLPTQYSNANVAAYLPTYSGELTASTSNISGNSTASFFIGNGSLLTGLPTQYSNANVAAYLPTYSGVMAASTSNVSGNSTAAFFIGDGSFLTNLNVSNVVGVYGNANVSGYLPVYGGNILVNTIEATRSITDTAVLGNSTVEMSTVQWTTMTSNSLSNVTLYEVAANSVSCLDFNITATDATSHSKQVAKILAVTYNNDYNYSEYGSLAVGNAVGNFTVELVGGNIILNVEPSTSNLTEYKVVINAYQ
jgi:hypothetical protein